MLVSVVLEESDEVEGEVPLSCASLACRSATCLRRDASVDWSSVTDVAVVGEGGVMVGDPPLPPEEDVGVGVGVGVVGAGVGEGFGVGGGVGSGVGTGVGVGGDTVLYAVRKSSAEKPSGLVS